jgi:hypothetical protein
MPGAAGVVNGLIGMPSLPAIPYISLGRRAIASVRWSGSAILTDKLHQL